MAVTVNVRGVRSVQRPRLHALCPVVLICPVCINAFVWIIATACPLAGLDRVHHMWGKGKKKKKKSPLGVKSRSYVIQ